MIHLTIVVFQTLVIWVLCMLLFAKFLTFKILKYLTKKGTPTPSGKPVSICQHTMKC